LQKVNKMEKDKNIKEIVIPITVTEQKFYRQFLEIYKPVILSILKQVNGSDVKLYQKELDILSEMLYYANRIPNLENYQDYIFNSAIRKEIRTNVGLDTQTFNTHLSNMRSKKIIENNRINHYLIISAVKQVKLTFKFDIKNE
jgi:hypothetical protein